ncbi:MAG TPA: ATP-binding protein [Polyangia bacterium]|jgi:signal transduction histidine kinase
MPPAPATASRGPAEGEDARPYLSGRGYGRLRRTVVLATAAVSIVPLVIISFLYSDQYERSLRAEAVDGITRQVTNNKRALEFFLTERRSALGFIVRDRSFAELCDAETLPRIMKHMNESFALGSFADLGLIDAGGRQLCYTGAYDLKGRDYHDQDWFYRVSRRGVFISDVFLGYRNSPHFAIATKHDRENGGYYILRATINADILAEQILTAGLTPHDDVFLVNRDRVLQSPSRRYGAVLKTVPLAVPHATPEVNVLEQEDEAHRPIVLGCAQIADSPFVLVSIRTQVRPQGRGFSLPRLLAFLLVSIAFILGVILWGSRQFVANLRAQNLRRAELMHKVEYSNKLATVGRLAAGVAHEINNPLSIINEKAGLLKDLVNLEPELPRRDKVLGIVDSLLGSVARCRKVTHRLLGFAKHMDVQSETIDVGDLLREVVGFLGQEAEYRGVAVTVEADPGAATIVSDRGQLQQVFLNILNNAEAAVKDGGHIDIGVRAVDEQRIAVTIADDGVGIPRENLERIFEPFFTTKEGSGTGLGLSITYGIVQKLGGDISVESEVGEGTCFTVLLPTRGKG